MTQDPNRPLTPPGDPRMAPEADRPAAGPETAGDPGSAFPRDEGLEDQPADQPGAYSLGSSGGGAPQSVDPGLADRAPGRSGEQPAWGQATAGTTPSTFGRDEGLEGRPSDRSTEPGMASAGGGAPQTVDPGLADQTPGGPAERPAWGHGQGAAGGTASTLPADEAGASPGFDRAGGAGTGAPGGGATQMGRGLDDQPGGGLGDRAALDRFRGRWASVQGAFVDDPRNAVAEADRLVAEVIHEVEQRLTRRRESIQGQWTGGEVDTEQLRRLVHGYRALFHRLLETDF